MSDANPIKDHREAFDAHIDWLRRIEDDGTMFASGLLKDEKNWDGSGMASVRAASYEDAVKIAEEEPFHTAGVRKNDVQVWMMNEANFQFSLMLINQQSGVS